MENQLKNVTSKILEPSHTPKNTFQYLTNSVNEWSSEYNVRVDNKIQYQNSPHHWDKTVYPIKPNKKGTSNYRFRLGKN